VQDWQAAQDVRQHLVGQHGSVAQHGRGGSCCSSSRCATPVVLGADAGPGCLGIRTQGLNGDECIVCGQRNAVGGALCGRAPCGRIARQLSSCAVPDRLT
jgi:hypothetical protein